MSTLSEQKTVISENCEKNVRNKISLISFICSIIVIYIHTYNLSSFGITEKSKGFAKAVFLFETYCESVTQLAVPMFFFISGFLFFRTFSMKKLGEKWKSRAVSVLLPYAVWCSIYYLYYVVCTNVPFVSSLMSGGEKVEFSLKVWLDRLWISEYYTLWFLKNLIVFILLSPLIFILLKNRTKKIPTGLIVLLAAEVVLNIPALNPLVEKLCLKGADVYLAGCYIGINHKEWVFLKNKKASAAGLAVCALYFICGFRFFNTATKILFFVSAWLALDFVKIKRIPWWMSVTFFTYVSHDLFLEAAEKVVQKVLGTSPAVALTDYVFMPVIIEIFLIIMAYVLMRFCPHLWKILSGGRNMLPEKEKVV